MAQTTRARYSEFASFNHSTNTIARDLAGDRMLNEVSVIMRAKCWGTHDQLGKEARNCSDS